MVKVKIYVEKAQDGTYWGTTENLEGIVSVYGNSLSELKMDLQKVFDEHLEVARELEEDWVAKYENGVEFEYKMDLEGFFNLIPEVKIGSIAEKAKINSSLLRQYKTGKANASEDQTKKIEKAIHELGQELLSVSF
ncbi:MULTISPECIES: type II toxin-antitoxin system HicB family antitoxin [Aequorivita]|jgi:predicted RNase H-like HicB family nuclease|uniref:Type II toxin-antitoxin system HicB family antitoxin n=2 Tax=Aequorivita TaxID=153265 RepID=A0AB35YU07_9FLAO|nr:type II toxin-antitoxin system HicB family antitoxin [Aequorivita sp. Ant34-E75]WGF93715.1 type II toxin-antitoxin system HicB family antitoxin [Aequorivita sp. Ant34-E75]